MQRQRGRCPPPLPPPCNGLLPRLQLQRPTVHQAGRTEMRCRRWARKRRARSCMAVCGRGPHRMSCRTGGPRLVEGVERADADCGSGARRRSALGARLLHRQHCQTAHSTSRGLKLGCACNQKPSPISANVRHTPHTARPPAPTHKDCCAALISSTRGLQTAGAGGDLPGGRGSAWQGQAAQLRAARSLCCHPPPPQAAVPPLHPGCCGRLSRLQDR